MLKSGQFLYKYSTLQVVFRYRYDTEFQRKVRSGKVSICSRHFRDSDIIRTSCRSYFRFGCLPTTNLPIFSSVFQARIFNMVRKYERKRFAGTFDERDMKEAVGMVLSGGKCRDAAQEKKLAIRTLRKLHIAKSLFLSYGIGHSYLKSGFRFVHVLQ